MDVVMPRIIGFPPISKTTGPRTATPVMIAFFISVILLKAAFQAIVLMSGQMAYVYISTDS